MKLIREQDHTGTPGTDIAEPDCPAPCRRTGEEAPRLGALVGKAHLRMRTTLAHELEPHRITPEQWIVMKWLWSEDGISQRELAERCDKDAPTTARILDKLEQKGLIERRPDPADRRTQRVHMTADGNCIRPVLTAAADHSQNRALRGFSDEERACLTALLRRIIANTATHPDEQENTCSNV